MKKLAIVFLTVMMAWPVAAQTPVNFTVSEDISYDDNIYLTKDDTEGSMISTTRVGADYASNIPGSGLELSAKGLVGYNAYTKDSSTNNYWDALGAVQLKNDWMTIGDRFVYTSDPANSSLTERVERIQNVGYASFKTSSEKMFGLGLSVDDIFDRYMKADYDYLNRNRVNLGAQVYYNLSPKTVNHSPCQIILAEYLHHTLFSAEHAEYFLRIICQIELFKPLFPFPRLIL